MPSVRIHCAVSRERTDFNFKRLHEWIDEPYKKLGVNHRLERHADNSMDRKAIRDFWDKEKGEGWGDKAVVEWLFHISIDNLETAFKEAQKSYRKGNAYNFFKFGMIPQSKWIYFDFDALEEDELENEFDDVYKDEEDDNFDEEDDQ